MRVAIYTLGCKVNQFETGAMERMLKGRGHTVVGWEDPSDAYIINSCAVTALSEKKTLRASRSLRARRPGAVLAVCGCLGRLNPSILAKTGADLVWGPSEHAAFISRLEEIAQKGGAETAPPARHVAMPQTFERLPPGSAGGRTRALLKIQDGCDNRCAYCVIPQARGPARSLPLNAAAAEASGLAASGYREIIITGIEISSWGRDLDGHPGLADAVECVSKAAPGARVRLGSLEPRSITEDFVSRLSLLPDLCPHFHVSLQSGCDDTLRRMGRQYDTALFSKSVSLLREAFPDCALTTDLIVGFPGESEDEFGNTLRFAKSCAFSRMHIFPYSRREGTPAATFDRQVPEAEKKRRAAQAGELAREMSLAYAHACVGRTLDVLFEESNEGIFRGHAENYMAVTVVGIVGGEGQGAPVGKVCPILITGVDQNRELTGRQATPHSASVNT